MPLIREKTLSLIDILARAVALGASDVDFSPLKPVLLRVDGELKVLDPDRIIEQEDTKYFLDDYLTKEQRERYFEDPDATKGEGKQQRQSYERAIQIQTDEVSSRARLHFYRSKDGICLSCRIIPLIPPTMEALLIPPVVKSWIDGRGIVIIAGLVNNGKTTSLASIVHQMNMTESEKILILEDPIEFVHKDIKSWIFSREVGLHTPSYADGLRDLSREGTNTVIVGEVRNKETMDAVFSIAEKGLRVFMSLHAPDTVGVIESITNWFPKAEDSRVLARLAYTVKGILTQELLRKPKGGRILATEIFTNSVLTSPLLKEGRIQKILDCMKTGSEECCSLKLYKEKLKNKELI